ncbi:MAG: hypothetical protein H0X27_08575 [Caulobacteraceae bacterium]|nr:hypothetical protein [Caulobacteraceae bacterium]
MAFSYTLFLALVLLFPGLCAWAGLRATERTDLLTPRPEKPNSTATLFIIALGAVAGYLLGAFAFVLQGLWCRLTGLCVAVAFDPNIYRVVFTSGRTAGQVTDLAILAWLLELALTGGGAGAFVGWLARREVVKDRWDAIDFGWLHPAVRQVKTGDAVILAYVVTNTSHEGASVAYEGIVQQLALNDDQTITMLVLSRVDRFLLRITSQGIQRVDEEHEPIAQMQLHLSEIANVALEVIESPKTDLPPVTSGRPLKLAGDAA